MDKPNFEIIKKRYWSNDILIEGAIESDDVKKFDSMRIVWLHPNKYRLSYGEVRKPNN
jgi:hypothetical protein